MARKTRHLSERLTGAKRRVESNRAGVESNRMPGSMQIGIQQSTVASTADAMAVRLEALIRLADAIRSEWNSRELVPRFASELQQVIPFAAFAQTDRSGTASWFSVHDGAIEPMLLSSSTETLTAGQPIFQSQAPLFLNQSDSGPAVSSLAQLWKLGMRSVCILPLGAGENRLGALVFASRSEDAYPEHEHRFLTLAAAQIAAALSAAEIVDARSLERTRLLLELTNRIVSKLELRELLQEIFKIVRSVMNSDAVGVALADPETGELRHYASDFGNRPGPSGEAMLQCVQRAYQTGQRVYLMKQDLATEPDRFRGPAPPASLCLLPLISRGRVLGVFGAGSQNEDAFTSADFDFLGRVADQMAIAVENALAFQEITQLKDKLDRENVYLESEIRAELGFEEIIGNSEALRKVLGEIKTVAPADSTVLIEGETGSGKELIARALHNLSSRSSNAFVKLNCAAIPTGLLESELFGHEKGAFTGAITQRIGRFELAHRGTIFLDEIGEIPLELQPKLLRVLQEREFERLGSTRTLRTDARLIAATNRDLKSMVDEGRFRSDLYYRLHVFPIRVPALRERPEDIPLLVRHFVQQFSQRNHRVIDTIPTNTMEALVQYHWPGNIRELQNVIERAVIISKGPILNVPIADLRQDSDTRIDRSHGETGQNKHSTLQDALAETERSHILKALEQANWVIAGPNGAAARLGLKRSTLQMRMQKLGIRLSRTLDAANRTRSRF
jgi:formate hydrogenlyase transcriptional activator